MRVILTAILIVGIVMVTAGGLAGAGLHGPLPLGAAWAMSDGNKGLVAPDYAEPQVESAVGHKPRVEWVSPVGPGTAASSAPGYHPQGPTSRTQYGVQERAVTGGNVIGSITAQQTPSNLSAVRSFAPSPVTPGGQLEVTIAVTGHGGFGRVVETLPSGFSYVSSTLNDDQVDDQNLPEVKFTLFGGTGSFTYTVTAPNTEQSYRFSGTLTDSHRNEVQVGGALSIAVSARPNVNISRAAGSQGARVRLNSPISLTATFSESVTGFSLTDIAVRNGTVGNFAGSGAAYTFEVTPNAIGEVTVDMRRRRGHRRR